MAHCCPVLAIPHRGNPPHPGETEGGDEPIVSALVAMTPSRKKPSAAKKSAAKKSAHTPRKKSAQGPTYQKVLVGSDGTERAGRAVERAADVAKALGANLTVLGVGSEGQLRAVLERQVAPLTDAGVDVEVQIEPGTAAQVLIDVATRDGYDLLVLGNKGMSGIERLRLGAVPNKVSHHLPCSLLIVRTG